MPARASHADCVTSPVQTSPIVIKCHQPRRTRLTGEFLPLTMVACGPMLLFKISHIPTNFTRTIHCNWIQLAYSPIFDTQIKAAHFFPSAWRSCSAVYIVASVEVFIHLPVISVFNEYIRLRPDCDWTVSTYRSLSTCRIKRLRRGELALRWEAPRKFYLRTIFTSIWHLDC